MMTLSPELQSSLESKIKQFEKERTMPLMSNMELRGMERGEIEEIIGKMTNPTILEELLKLAATANSLAEFKQSLAKIQS
ncbi:MAG: hypothetical protein EWV85_08035 [Microcystis aeruginosa Ma_QC_C_20070703_M131]|uniref:DUF4351 domain-containing protein n=1 Tax=Microcystis aeruginosa Ma_QC_C_20070703_M131 TaxID=2486263 RepID=A0A551Y6I4_MICAE|nr:MAG: hypothetical protein EWV85_08035 [Microcystis aeruginosa Ma_QC_C_20070703_M131]